MTRAARNTTGSVLLTAVVMLAVGAAFLPLTAERATLREIDLVIRDMAFYIDGDPAPNPVLTLAPGVSVVVTVRNEEPGIVHDFGVPAWDVATRRLRSGESARIVLTAPAVKGSTAYICSPHSAMMRGTITVQ